MVQKKGIPDKILSRVQKPARYIGNELNSVHKNPEDVSVRFAFCFPDVYEIGMSHLGIKILYHMLNDREDVFCERVFTPWVDMEKEMRENEIPLYAMESGDAINTFDFVAFTLQYEMSYSNIINMLDLAGIPLLASERKNGEPFICAGGPCAYNPEPLSESVDFFMMGEGEEILNEVVDVYKKWKEQNRARVEFLEMISEIEGVYVPSFYNVEYGQEGTICKFSPQNDSVPVKIKKRIMKDLDKAYYPEKSIVPFIEIVHDRIMLEIFRGCTRGCRFCQAGIIYRPVRERTPKRLAEIARKLYESTGYEEVSLSSLSSSDYTGLESLTNELLKLVEDHKINLALPSLRVDSFSLGLINRVQKVRKSGLTFAPEAGTQRLRDVINKGVSEEDLIRSVTLAFENGFNNIKLYFMIGLPSETDEDVEGIATLTDKVVDAYFKIPREGRNKGLKITVSASSFVPKAFTPFQWESQNSIEEIKRKQGLLSKKINRKFVNFNWNDPEVSMLEGVFARGDRRLNKVLIAAHKKGCKFDGWQEYFNFDKWMDSFKDCGIDPLFYTTRNRDYKEFLPWEHIDVGVTKGFLIGENEKAKKGELTPNCRDDCSGCGVAVFEGGVCIE